MTTIIRDQALVDRRIRELDPLIDRLQFALRDRPIGIAAATRAADCLSADLPTRKFSARTRRPAILMPTASMCCTSIGRFRSRSSRWCGEPGQRTSVHDHRCWGAVAVLQGAEHETLYSLRGQDQLVPGRQTSYPAGDISAFAPPGDIHQVQNRGPATAISLHVYGADIAVLGSSIRRSYAENLITV